MIREQLYIEPYDWTVYAYLDSKSVNADEILQKVDQIGISASEFMKAERHLQRAVRNSGMTYSSGTKRESVVVIAHSTSEQETLNTFTHELRHLVDDIAMTSGVPSSGEEIAYLTGNISLGLAAGLLKTICECPVCSSHQ